MAAGPASPGALLIGWVVTGVGMLALARTFQYLGRHAEDPGAGLHGYARDGFGPLAGFLAAWGYWISAWLGNLAYLPGADLLDPLGIFVPAFGDGTTWVGIAGASVVLWLYTALLLRGVREASGVNVLVTVAKLVPLLIFVVVAAVHLDPAVFTVDLWGREEGIGPVFDQVAAMMLVTVWAFLGIEGASVYARRARRREDVGRATVTGFLLVITLLFAVDILSAGILTRTELEALQDPSLAGVLDAVVRPWGAVLISVGLLVSVSGALLAWMMLCAEILSSTARGYALRLALGGRAGGRQAALTTAVGVVYAVWLIYAGGLDYLLMTGVFYAIGLVVHAWSRREQRRRVADGTRERVLVAVVVVAAVVAVVGFTTGPLSV